MKSPKKRAAKPSPKRAQKGNTVVQKNEAVSVLEKIRREADERKTQKIRKVTKAQLEKGCVPRQGDIYLHAVPKDHAHGQRLKTQQLVRGVTAGSRHMAQKPAKLFEGTTLPTRCRPGTLLGPFVVISERLRVSHPEHAALDLPAGSYQVTYQRDARTGGQVQD